MSPFRRKWNRTLPLVVVVVGCDCRGRGLRLLSLRDVPVVRPPQPCSVTGCPKEEKPVPLRCSAKNEDVQMASAAGFCGRANCEASRSRFGISFGKGGAVSFVPTCTRFGFLFMIKS
uniref:Putative secreted protein n=1 Tax=Ixodes ricinus TaxID=34613 RepID=A0A6B0ULE3_IXORI